ncbi:MAG TPA: hypothetical protein PK156_16490, partial [Polyangium sp.]|nr:hypothetical protein [Polyangium sp.]
MNRDTTRVWKGKWSKYNETHWKNAEFDKLLDQANSTIDPAERHKLYQAANKLIAEDGGAIAPVF